MEFTCAVLYNGEMAYYTVAQKDAQTFTVNLLSYFGSKQYAPPQKIVLFKEENNWRSEPQHELANDLGYKIALKQKLETSAATA